jgi:hypothetical protein
MATLRTLSVKISDLRSHEASKPSTCRKSLLSSLEHVVPEEGDSRCRTNCISDHAIWAAYAMLAAIITNAPAGCQRYILLLRFVRFASSACSLSKVRHRKPRLSDAMDSLHTTMHAQAQRSAERDFQARSTIVLPHASPSRMRAASLEFRFALLAAVVAPALPSACTDTPASRRGDKRLSTTSKRRVATMPAIRKDGCVRKD